MLTMENKAPLISPGHQLKQEIKKKALRNPGSKKSVEILSKEFDIRLPFVQVKRPPAVSNYERIVKGRNTKPLGPLPLENRNNPMLPPPEIRDRDMKSGILNLINRGFIPRGSNVIVSPEPVVKDSAVLHDFDEKFATPKNSPQMEVRELISSLSRTENASTSIHSASLARPSVPSPKKIQKPVLASRTLEVNFIPQEEMETRPWQEKPPRKTSYSRRLKKVAQEKLPSRIKSADSLPLPPPATPTLTESTEERNRKLVLAIQYGRLKTSNEQFVAIKEMFSLN